MALTNRRFGHRLAAGGRSAILSGIAILIGGSPANAGEVKVADYGTTKDGRAVTAYTLVNEAGASATILDFGGTIIDLQVPDRYGRMGNVVMSFADLAGWEAVGNANAIVGRYANRIRGGFTLDGVHHPLQQNAAGITLHGGPPPYSTRVWTVVPPRPEDGAAVTLSLYSPDGDQGFPGAVWIKATYRLADDNALRLDLSATTTKPTVINLTNHIYFNLNGNSTTSVYAHTLEMAADRVAFRDAANVPTGALVPVAGTPFDLRQGRSLQSLSEAATDPTFAASVSGSPVPARSFDYAYVLEDGPNRLTHIAARLRDDASGRVMELSTTEPAIHVYISNNARPGLLSDVGKALATEPAVALETEHLPDSPNQPRFPSTVLRPGELFSSTTIWTFKVENSR